MVHAFPSVGALYRAGSTVRRSAWVVAVTTIVAISVLFLLLPGVARADEPTLTRYDQTDDRIDYVGTWDTFEKSVAYMTAYGRANTRGASATIYFEGTQLDWIAMTGTSTGTADVYLDDVFKATVNLASPSAHYKVLVWSTGDLPSGQHKVTILRSPTCPIGKFVTLDAVDVAGSLIYGPPTITGLEPVSGSTAGGASVVINGSNFNQALAVTFGDVAAASFSVDSSTTITAVPPAHEAGTVNVTVTTPSGPSADTSADDYLYAVVTTPTLTGLSPSAGASGTSVVITGTGFIGLTGPDAVTFGGVNATSYTVDSPTRITAVAPSRDAATVQVKVEAAGGTTADTPAGDFTYFTRYDQTDSRFSYSGTWAAFTKTAAWNGSYGRTDTNGGSVTLTFAGTRLDWIAMKGTTTGQADVYLDGVFKTTIDLSADTASYQQNVWSTGAVANAVHAVKIVRNSDSPSGTYLTIDAVDVVGALIATERLEQADSHLAYAGTWSVVSTSQASGGSYRRATGSSAAVYVDFTGVGLSWVTTTGPGMGKAWVSVDGGPEESVDLHTAATEYQKDVWNTGLLGAGDHEIKIWWDQTNASGAYITTDVFEVLGTARQAYLWHRYEQTDLRMLCTGSWSTVTASGASGGSYKQTSSTAAFFDFLFTGRQVEWIATTGPGMGVAEVSVDGGAFVTVDLHSATTLHQQEVWMSPVLSDGLHRIQIQVSSDSVPGALIDVDAVEVHGTLPSASSTSAAKNMWAEKRLAELSYLPGTINGTYDYKTRGAVIAFEKWEGLSRDGAIGTTVWTRLHTATRPHPTKVGTTDPWIEVDKTKQVLLFCKNGQVLYTLHVSTGSASVGFVTPSGTFSIISKTPPRDHLYYPMAITSAVAIHGYPTVPTYPASHGCVRTQDWDQDVIYPITPMRTRVYVYDVPDKTPGATARIDQTNENIVKTGTWTDYTKTSAFRGSYGRSSTSGAKASAWFTGTQIAWIGMKGSTPGIVDVYLDGEKQATIDLYSSTTQYQATLWTSASLPDGLHHLELRRNADSLPGEYIVLDALDVWGEIVAPPPTINSLSPASGWVDGGTEVTIDGFGFAGLSGPSAVTFDGVPAANYIVNSSMRITATAPAHAVGTVDVVVTTTQGSSPTAGAANDFTYAVHPPFTRFEQTDTHIVKTGDWHDFTKEGLASGDSYGRSNSPGASATIYFEGTRIDWIAMTGSTPGKVDVYLDDEYQTTIDLESVPAQYDVQTWSTGDIDDGFHKLELRLSDSSDPGEYLTLDAVDIWGTIRAQP